MPAAQPAAWCEGTCLVPGLRSGHVLILNRRQQFSARSFLHAHLRVRLQGMPARVRGSGLRQAKSRVPEVPEQETGAAALRVRRVGEGDPVVDAGGVGTVRVMRRRSWAGGLLAQRPRLSPLFAIKSASRESARFVFDSSYQIYIAPTSFLDYFPVNAM